MNLNYGTCASECKVADKCERKEARDDAPVFYSKIYEDEDKCRWFINKEDKIEKV